MDRYTIIRQDDRVIVIDQLYGHSATLHDDTLAAKLAAIADDLKQIIALSYKPTPLPRRRIPWTAPKQWESQRLHSVMLQHHNQQRKRHQWQKKQRRQQAPSRRRWSRR